MLFFIRYKKKKQYRTSDHEGDDQSTKTRTPRKRKASSETNSKKVSTYCLYFSFKNFLIKYSDFGYVPLIIGCTSKKRLKIKERSFRIKHPLGSFE